MSTSSSSAATLDLEERVSALGKKDRLNQLYVVMKQKDLLSAEMKSYSDNIIIKGMKFSAKAVQKDEAAEEAFRVAALKVLVDQGLVPAKKLFYQGGAEKGALIRGVLRHVHPLGSKDNGNVVVAFLESWFAASILNKIVNGKKLTGGVRICQHMPPIIEALKNEALKARKAFLTADRNRKIMLKTTLRSPWIRLVETKDGQKSEITFDVEDGRLANPPLTLAKLEQTDKSFMLMQFLPPSERAAISKGTVKPSSGGDPTDLNLSDMDI